MALNRSKPEVGEIVIGEVININPNSLFIKLEEYDMKGMVHVSELSTGWVKDIRKFARMGQKMVLKVLPARGPKSKILNLSLKSVKPFQKKEKIEDVKNKKKALKLLSFLRKELDIDKDSKEEDRICECLLEAYEKSLYEAFSDIARDGISDKLSKSLGTTASEAVEMIAKDNVKIKNLFIKGNMNIKFTDSDGLEKIKKALDIDNERLKIKYISAPKYQIELEGRNYADIEKELSSITSKIEEYVKAEGGEFSFAKA